MTPFSHFFEKTPNVPKTWLMPEEAGVARDACTAVARIDRSIPVRR
ncbi:hypothetical protein [Ensifer adhaerens]|nr:hypothetical protein [Ensifer adhaerens]